MPLSKGDINIKLPELPLAEKVEKAKRLIQSVSQQHNFTLLYSGGKDSVILDFLIKDAGVKVDKVYCSTTIDPEGTINFCQKNGARILRPRRTFLELVERKGFPTMFRRFCCAELKEKYVADYAFVGIRRNESIRRSKCYTTVDVVRYYSKTKFTNQFLPLLNFTCEDEKCLAEMHGLEMHPLYYDQNGQFCPERRLGCIGCPLQSDRGREDFKRYPILLKQVLRRGIRFHQSHGRTENDAALQIVYNLFYSNHKYKQYEQTFSGLFSTSPWSMLNEHFGLEKDDVMRLLPTSKVK